jgi:hypothetical protein
MCFVIELIHNVKTIFYIIFRHVCSICVPSFINHPVQFINCSMHVNILPYTPF